MKFISYTHHGTTSWGLVTATGVIDLATPDTPSLRRAIETDRLHALAQDARGRTDSASLTAIEFLPVIPDPGKIICVGHNYEEHRVETQRDKTENPSIFLRVAPSQTGHLAPLVLPPESTQLDYEGEIAIVIGKGGRRIAQADAWDHIAGYSAYNDGSVRDWQKHTMQFTPGKNFNRTGAFGPWLVTRDEIGDGQELTVETRLNGSVMQHATTAMMIFPIPRLIEYTSTFTTLEPGDVIVSGTPGGVGARRQPPVWMKPGDRIEIEVSGVGVLCNTVVAEEVGA
ncbi:fumarylacetoacetate hydrolase family protein [Hydrogenophaga sp.]|uniref:fumarylacetoacetate hydrolase family protein n=1 Tax=Hydrogenophaga sp. TaxID=1904254 RepID=UPI002718B794|nr:fumarylacetoacetate hydrolase family protein [Hydrogenophaga sp.]MDO9437635.1 fumarylacetoacetate hydrolase family protein [Hydrogenophaga sp.]